MKKPENLFISDFKAVFNPYTKFLAVKYGNTIIEHHFNELDEWVCINYNYDENQPYYLHVHLHYEESLQLLFYPRHTDSEELNESQGTYYNTLYNQVPANLYIVHNDVQEREALNLITIEQIIKT